jgi:ribose transport system ATP-binding protein
MNLWQSVHTSEIMCPETPDRTGRKGSTETREGCRGTKRSQQIGPIADVHAAISPLPVVFRTVASVPTAPNPPSMAPRTVLLAARDVTVDYPGVRALDGVNIEFRSGEIHAIVGENGAGKSTLMKVLSGSVRATVGTVQIQDGAVGRDAHFTKPADALRAGIAMVHQELNLVRALDVAENIVLGREPVGRLGIAIERRAQRARAAELLTLLGADIDPTKSAADLSIAEAQFVEIAKCLASDARVLIFDEPTAVLGERDALRLMALFKRLRDEGRAIIFISHHLDEVVAVADRTTVLRDGRVVQEFVRDQVADGTFDESVLAAAMVGRDLGSMYPEKGACDIAATPAIELIGFGAVGRSRGISLVVRPGEIVGVAGLVGSGRTETAEAIVGLRPSEGSVRVAGRTVRFRSPREALAAGVTYVSEDRKGRGLHTTLSSIINTTMPSLDRYARLGGLRLDERAERGTAARWIRDFAIRCARPELPISSLSGGNQQKFALGRWLETGPRVLIVDEPTRGVDVGAKGEIYRILADLASQGLACIVISSELPEVIGLSHRVVVLYAGEVAGELPRERLLRADCEERIVRLASGLSEEKESVL